MAAMLNGRNNENVLHWKEHLFPQEQESIARAMQHAAMQNLFSQFAQFLKSL